MLFFYIPFLRTLMVLKVFFTTSGVLGILIKVLPVEALDYAQC